MDGTCIVDMMRFPAPPLPPLDREYLSGFTVWEKIRSQDAPQQWWDSLQSRKGKYTKLYPIFEKEDAS